MKANLFNIYKIACLLAISFLVSCSQEDNSILPQDETIVTADLTTDLAGQLESLSIDFEPNTIELDRVDVVVPSECGTTFFRELVNEELAKRDALGFTYLNLWRQVNYFYSTFLNDDPQYFGADGSYTNLMVKRIRELENFWGLDGVEVRGQHNSTLNDRDAIALVFMTFGGSSEAEAYNIADIFLEINEESTFLNESPLISFDAFASFGGYIVMGDGIVELIARAGIDPNIIWTGILAHEWAHQLFIDNITEWYPDGIADNQPEATRTIELEADFMSAYYAGHKRGATYNMKRMEDFYEIFFGVGDCGFNSPGHHGTPLQRMRAAEAGHELAASTFPKGMILSADEVHDIFIAMLNDIVNGDGGA